MAPLNGKSVLPSGGSAFILNSKDGTPMPNAFVHRQGEWKFSLALSIVLILLALGTPILGPILLAPRGDVYKEAKDSAEVLLHFGETCDAEFDLLCDHCNWGGQCLLMYEHPLRAMLRNYWFSQRHYRGTRHACSLETIMQLIPHDEAFRSDNPDQKILEGLVANFVQSLYYKVNQYYGFVGLDEDLRREGSHNMANIAIASLLHFFGTPFAPAEGYTPASWHHIAPYYTRDQVLDEIEFSMRKHSFRRNYPQSLLMNTTAVISNLLTEFRDDISHIEDHHSSFKPPINRICEPQKVMSTAIIRNAGLVSCLARYHERDIFLTRKCKTAFEQLPIKLRSFGDDLDASVFEVPVPTNFIVFVFYMVGAALLAGTRHSKFEQHCRRKVRHLKQEMEDPFLRRGWERQAFLIVGEGECEAQLKKWKDTVDNVNVKDVAMRMHRLAMKKLRRLLSRIFAVMVSLFLLDCCLLRVMPFRTGILILLMLPLTFTITYLAPYWNPKVETKSMSHDEEIPDSGIQLTQPLLPTEEKRILSTNLNGNGEETEET